MANVTFTTAKQAHKLRLVADRQKIGASRSDLSYVVAEVVDAAGVLVTCEDESQESSCSPPVVTFAVSGAGELEAVGSGDPIDPSSFKGPARKTYRGRATAIVRPDHAAAAPLAAAALSLLSLSLTHTRTRARAHTHTHTHTPHTHTHTTHTHTHTHTHRCAPAMLMRSQALERFR